MAKGLKLDFQKAPNGGMLPTVMPVNRPPFMAAILQALQEKPFAERPEVVALMSPILPPEVSE
jgi:hypothetical protein